MLGITTKRMIDIREMAHYYDVAYKTIEIDYSVKLSTGKGEIEWEHAFEDYNSVKKIDYPNLKKYK